MTGSSEINLLRDGRTMLKAEGKFRGRLDPSLGEEGIPTTVPPESWP
jgi:hypothetical protein